jgi:CheY-like chemotaxis protein
MTANDLAEFLMVEDNPADVRLTREAFRDGNILNTLHVVKDGVEAMAFLRRQGIYASMPTPALIFLDLNLPRKNGREVLREIKEDKELRKIPVIVLTTSSAESDIVSSYALHANAYVVKPINVETFNLAIKEIDRFWNQTAVLPPPV